jgi:serine/threonine protein kinase
MYESPAQNKPLREGFLFSCQGYRIESQLSTSGFFMTYLARDEEGELFVIREYLPARLARRGGDAPCPIVDDDKRQAFDLGLENFFAEATALARIDHPNVVKVVALFRANETAYVVRRHEPGHNLQDVIRLLSERGEAITEDVLRHICVAILDGLQEVHDRRLLHLDIQPGNVHLRKNGQPMLINFGASRLPLREVVMPLGTNLGSLYTPGFAAPEQEVPGEPIGPWTDIYAIGATLYSCLAGRPPMAARARRRADTLEPAERRWLGQYSPQLLELIDWCMHLDPDRRPRSAQVLQRVLKGELLDLVDPDWFISPMH